MNKDIYIKIVRNSDRKEFNIGPSYDWRLLVEGLEGFGLFENQLNYVDNATRDGGVITSNRLSQKDRTIKCANINFNYNDVVRKEALSFFNAKDTYKVYITYAGITRWAEGYIYKFNLPNKSIDKRLELTVTFMFANPYLKSVDSFGQDIASVTPGIGFPFMCTEEVGFTAGVYNFAQSVLLKNDGDVDTYCTAVFTATGEVVNPKLIINGEYVRVIDTMQAGDVITMDFTSTPPTVKKNGQNYIGHCDRTSAFDSMILKVGDTEVKYAADTGSNEVTVNIYYNELFCAI